MAALELQLLGSFKAALGGEKLESFRTQKAQALLIYLAIEPEAHRRENLTAILWPGMPNARREAIYDRPFFIFDG